MSVAPTATKIALDDAPPSDADAPIFAVSRDRDAWATIRGFVYQVDVTIRRWIGLGDTDWLELESGEDIDLVTSAVADEANGERLVEQVKQREAATRHHGLSDGDVGATDATE